MASLSASFKIGNASASSLIKTGATVQRELATFQDDQARITYENSAKTAADLQTYQNYLQGRINSLQAAGTITDLTKAQTMQQDIVSATHANISADIVRENINLMSQGMSGTVQGYQDKMQVVGQEYTRALGVGDNALAQSLMSQYYSLSQSAQNAAATAASASSTLGSAASTSGATYQGEVYTNLEKGLTYLSGLAKGGSEQDLNAALTSWVQQNKSTLSTLGVDIQGKSPNYWDVVYGVTGAMYNAKVLQAQAESATNPIVAQGYAMDAANLLSGQTKISTLGGSLTVQQIQEAQQNPQMFAYDNTTGQYKQTAQSGFQYMNINGTQQVVPSFSGYAEASQRNKVLFLSPTQTTLMNKLGLVFGDTKAGYTGDGVLVQTTNQSVNGSPATPQWLRNVLGNGGVANMYVTQNGFLQFKGASSTGTGDAVYTLAQDGKGLAGLYQQDPMGNHLLVGGDYGFQSDAVQLLLNQGQQQQHIVQVELAQQQQQLQLAMQQHAQALKVAMPAPVKAPTPITQVARLQPAAAPQLTASPQPATVNPQPTTANPQQTVNGFNLNQSGSGGIQLHATAARGIPL